MWLKNFRCQLISSCQAIGLQLSWLKEEAMSGILAMASSYLNYDDWPKRGKK